MNIRFVLLLIVVGIAVADTRADTDYVDRLDLDDQLDFFRDEWAQFQNNHNFVYETPEEEERRFGIFVDNYQFVLQHNMRHKQNKHSFQIEMNLFGDRTLQEHVQLVNGFNQTLQQSASRADALVRSRKRRATARLLPATVDWRTKGAVGPVLNQGRCGSCWTFATAAAFEGQYFLKHGQLPALSQQQLMDCSRDHGNNGCKGGIPRYAMDYVWSVGGMASAVAYPYVTQQQQCTLQKADVLAMRGGAHPLTYGSEIELMQAVANVGPIAIAIDASQRSFQFYKTGVYYEQACRPGFTDHAVLVVGYGTDAATGENYWLVKNSYGPKWGENGYIRMARNRGNNCCVACWGVYPYV